MSKARCKICGYVYHSENGEDTKDVVAGTEWEDVPEDFRCPSCGAKKKLFIEIN
jgi:rubredoxin